MLPGLASLGALLVFGGLRPSARMGEDARKIAHGDLSARLDPALQCEELRDALAAILADCEFPLHKPRGTERYLETIVVCQESARHLGKLVERPGSPARLDSDETALEIEPLDLADAAGRAISWVEPLAREPGITPHAELSEVHAAADPLRNGQVLLKLLRNAVVYNRSGGSVTVRNGMATVIVHFDLANLFNAPRPLSFGKDGAATRSRAGAPIAAALVANLPGAFRVNRQVSAAPVVGNLPAVAPHRSAGEIHALPIPHEPDLPRAAFRAEGITAEKIALALAQFLLTLSTRDAKFDQAIAGKTPATAQETHGFGLLMTEYEPRPGQLGADCFHCHGGALFSDHQFHNNGLSGDDPGRAKVTGSPAARGEFSTPSPRNIVLAGHDDHRHRGRQRPAHHRRRLRRGRPVNIAARDGFGRDK